MGLQGAEHTPKRLLFHLMATPRHAVTTTRRALQNSACRVGRVLPADWDFVRLAVVPDRYLSCFQPSFCSPAEAIPGTRVGFLSSSGSLRRKELRKGSWAA